MAGDVADMMLDGTLCEGCGAYLDDGPAPGFPRYCSSACAPEGVEVDDDFDDDGFDLEFEVECLRVTVTEGRAAAEGLSPAAIKLIDDLEAALKAFDAADQAAREAE
jgi:hypothetical protein